MKPEALLRQSRLRVTVPRVTIIEKLGRARRPLSIEEIHRTLKGRCDWATVFRCLGHFEKARLVRQCDFGDGQRRYELTGGGCGRGHHHHHLVCRACGNVVPIEGCDLRRIEQRLARQHRFAAITHSLEFFGTCPECRRRRGR